jgi:uncharacterized membrane protein YphA (DoxX/SURF4 family)
VQGAAYFATWHELWLQGWALVLLAVACGVLLLIGYLTPFAGVVAGLFGLGVSLSWFPATSPDLFEGKLTAVFATSIAVTLVCLGPGAFSVDARLFGRREIIIPNGSWSAKY